MNIKNKNMKKLTANELLILIEENSDNVSSFAYGDFPITPDNFEYSVELQNKINNDNLERERIKNAMEETGVASASWQERRDHPIYSELQDQLRALPFLNKLKTNEVLNSLGIGEWEEIEQYGGEDCGSTWYSIKYFKDHDVYIKTNGHYQSYNGTEFYDGYGEEVKPVQKTVTVYE